jgi:hypothetical protein
MISAETVKHDVFSFQSVYDRRPEELLYGNLRACTNTGNFTRYWSPDLDDNDCWVPNSPQYRTLADNLILPRPRITHLSIRVW